MTPEAKLRAFYMNRRLPTSSCDDTGAAFAEVNARLAEAEYGSAEAALTALDDMKRKKQS